MIRRESSFSGGSSSTAPGQLPPSTPFSQITQDMTAQQPFHAGGAPAATAPAQAQQQSSASKPYKARERLYYEANYLNLDAIKGQSTHSATSAKANVFDGVMKKGVGMDDLGPVHSATSMPSSELPPITSLHEMLQQQGAPISEPLVETARAWSCSGGILGTVPLDLHVSAAESNVATKSVTVFGFPLAYRSQILSIFHELGPVERIDEGPGNWFHITFADQWSAQKALARNGTVLNHPGAVMIGVVPMQKAVEQVSFAAQSFMSPLKGKAISAAISPADLSTVNNTGSIYRPKAAAADQAAGDSAILSGEPSFFTKAVGFLFGW